MPEKPSTPLTFNQFIKTLPTKRVVVGQMADGTPLTVEVPTLRAEAPRG